MPAFRPSSSPRRTASTASLTFSPFADSYSLVFCPCLNMGSSHITYIIENFVYTAISFRSICFTFTLCNVARPVFISILSILLRNMQRIVIASSPLCHLTQPSVFHYWAYQRLSIGFSIREKCHLFLYDLFRRHLFQPLPPTFIPHPCSHALHPQTA